MGRHGRAVLHRERVGFGWFRQRRSRAYDLSTDGTLQLVQQPGVTDPVVDITGNGATDLAQFKNTAGTVVAKVAADGTGTFHQLVSDTTVTGWDSGACSPRGARRSVVTGRTRSPPGRL